MNKVLNTTSASLLALATLAAQPAFAEYNYFDNVYFAAGGGGALQQDRLQGIAAHDARYYTDLKRKNVGAYRAAIGTAIGEVRAEFEFLGLADRNFYWQNSSSYLTADYTAKIRNQAVLLNGYYDFKGMMDMVTPYISAGVGVAMNQVIGKLVKGDAYNASSDLGYITKKSTTDFAWQVGLGAKFDVAENFFFDINYRFLGLGKAKANSVINLTSGNTVDLGASAVKGNIYNHVFLASIGLKF